MDVVTRDQGAPLTPREPAWHHEGDGAPPFAIPEEGVLRRLARRKLVFAATFAAVLALVAGAYLLLPATYKAETSIAIQPSDEVLASQRAAAGDQMTVGDTADLESQSIVLSSPTLLRTLLAAPAMRAAALSECALRAPAAWKRTARAWLGLPPHPSCQDQVADAAGLVAELRSRLAVAASGRSRVLTLAFVSRSPAFAQLVANGLVNAYLERRTREKLEPRDAAIAWLRDRVKTVSDRLEGNEGRIDAFLHANGVIRGETASIASEQLTGLAQQISLAETEQATAAGRLQQARLQGGATGAVLQDTTATDVKQRLAALAAQIAQSSARYGQNNPALQELQQQRRELQALLGRETGVVNRSAQADYQAATSRLDALRRQLDSLKREVRGNDDATTQVAALQREATTDRDQLADLTRNLNQLETDRRLVTPDARLVSLAEPPRSVFFPRFPVFALAGTLLATGLAAGVALLRDSNDRTVRKVASLQNAAALPVLARIPHVPGLGARSSRLVELLARPSPFQEAVRGLYAECLLVGGSGGAMAADGQRRRPRSFLVTSADRGEGKSLTVIALACFAAAAGRRVLVLECDLRRPDIGSSLTLGVQPGLSDVLRGLISAAEAVRQTDTPGLDVILAGKPATDSAELLAGVAMADLLAWATSRYDVVLIDTPPARVLPDARILSPAVDCVLYCARWGHSIGASVVQGTQEIQAAGGHVLGLVLGRVQPAEFRHYNMVHAGPAAYPVLGDG